MLLAYVVNAVCGDVKCPVDRGRDWRRDGLLFAPAVRDAVLSRDSGNMNTPPRLPPVLQAAVTCATAASGGRK